MMRWVVVKTFCEVEVVHADAQVNQRSRSLPAALSHATEEDLSSDQGPATNLVWSKVPRRTLDAGSAGLECGVEDFAAGDADFPPRREALKQLGLPCAYTPKKFMVRAIDVPRSMIPGKYFWIRYQNLPRWLMDKKPKLVDIINDHASHGGLGRMSIRALAEPAALAVIEKLGARNYLLQKKKMKGAIWILWAGLPHLRR